MLFDQKGNKVVVSDKLNTKTHPQVFSRLRETKDALDHKKNPMFRMAAIAKFRQ
jgi:hypothetical protein